LLEWSIQVLIVSWHNRYVKHAVSCPLSSSIARFAIGSIGVESRWKPSHSSVILGWNSQRLNEYWSDRQSENERRNRVSTWTFHI
jgi:hypothetical protein